MKERLFMLITALVMCVTGAWADGNVAKIGDTEYATFAEAVTAANTAVKSAAVTINLLDNITLDKAVTLTGASSKRITIKGDYTINCSKSCSITAKYTTFQCSLYVDGDVSNTGGALNASTAVYANRDIHVTGSATSSSCYYGYSTTTSNVTIDGSISAGNFRAASVVKHSDSSVITITGGNFYGKVENALISGGTYYSGSSTTATTVSAGTFKSGSTLKAETITGGTFAVCPNCSNIKGGTFQGVTDKSVFDGKIADGYVLVETSTANQYNVIDASSEKVAEIEGGEQYYTLESALKNATSGQKVTVLKNIETTSTTVVSGTNAVLELNGYTIGSITNSGTLTIQDSKGTGKIVNPSTYTTTVTNKSGAILTILSGIISYNGTSTSSAAVQNASGTITLEGGTLSSSGGYCLKNTGTATTTIEDGSTITGTGNQTQAIYAEGGIVTINGGTVSSSCYGIYDWGGTIYVNGGTISGNTYGLYVCADCGSVKVSGETITGSIYAGASVAESETVFSYYGDVATAITGATEGQTVKLLKDATNTDVQWIEKSITLDLNGKTITSSGVAVLATSYNCTGLDITIKNGTLNSTYTQVDDNQSWVVHHGTPNSTLTMDGVTTLFTNTGTDENDIVINSHAAGSTVNIKNCTLSGNATAEDAVTTGVFSDADNITLNVEKTTINSKYFGIYNNGAKSGFNGTIKNCVVTDSREDGASVYISGSSSLSTFQNLTITDSKITGATAIETKFTNVTINESEEGKTVLAGTAEEFNYKENGNGTCTTGAALAITDNSGNGVTAGTVTINGGHFNSAKNIFQATKDGVTDKATITLYKGCYTNSKDDINNTGFVAVGKVAIDNWRDDKETYPTTIDPISTPVVYKDGARSTTQDVTSVETWKQHQAVATQENDMLVVPSSAASSYTDDTNVIVVTSTTTEGVTTTSYDCKNLTITDRTTKSGSTVPLNMTYPVPFKAHNAYFNRNLGTKAQETKWGTICLPYPPTDTDKNTYYSLTGATSDGTNISLSFTRVTDPQANIPYLFKAGTVETGGTVNFTMSVTDGRTVTEPSSSVSGGSVGTEVTCELIGLMKSTSVVDGTTYTEKNALCTELITDPKAYYLDEKSDNAFHPLNGRVNFYPFRCYLKITTSKGAKASAINVNFDDLDDETTGVKYVESEDGKTVTVIYDLSGRRLNAPQKGVNIINGKKVLVK